MTDAARCEAPPGRQRGVVLFIVLIALVAMLLAASSLIRSVDTANAIAGNFAFRKAATAASDLGVEAALGALNTIVTTSLDQNIPNQYFASMQPVDANGLPTTVNWANVPMAAAASGNTVKYVIDRLCNGPLPVTNVISNCVADLAPQTGSKKAGAVQFSSSPAVYYRVTVQVTGPHNATSYVQAMLSH